MCQHSCWCVAEPPGRPKQVKQQPCGCERRLTQQQRKRSRMLFYFRKLDVFDTILISAGPKIFLTCLWDSLLFKFISLSLALPPVCVMRLCCFTPRWYLSGRLWGRTFWSRNMTMSINSSLQILMDLETGWLFRRALPSGQTSHKHFQHFERRLVIEHPHLALAS